MYKNRSSKALIVLLLFLFCFVHRAYSDKSKCNYSAIEVDAYNAILKVDSTKFYTCLSKIENNYNKIGLESRFILIQNLIYDNESDFNKGLKKQQILLKELNKLPANNCEFYLLNQFFVNLNIGIHYLKIEDYYKTAVYIYKAYELLKEGKKKYPNNPVISLYYITFEELASTIPKSYSIILKLLNIIPKNHEQNDIHNLESHFKNQYVVFKNDFFIISSYLDFFIYKDFNKIKKIYYSYSTKNNSIALFALGHLGNKLSSKSLNSKFINEFQENKNFPQLYYLLGEKLAGELNYKAGFYYKEFLANSKINSLTAMAYLKLSWFFYLDNKIEFQKRCLKVIENIPINNQPETKQAKYEASMSMNLHKELLKARLLFDGGNFNLAKELMYKIKTTDLNRLQKTEYYYRFGRIHQELKNYNSALFYLSKLETDNLKYGYYQPASLYYKGFVYEKLLNKNKAIEFYEKTLAYEDYSYKKSFDQLAKAGINRLK